MHFARRIIPILQLDKRRLYKTLNFIPKRYLGDPLNALRIFNLKQANEVIIVDINATQSSQIDFAYLSKITAQAFIPLAYGGGVNSIEDVHKLYQIGFDRVILSTAVFKNQALISEIASIYGTQSVICALDVRKAVAGEYKIYACGGRQQIMGLSLSDAVQKAVSLGAGEIFINNIDRDGTYLGLDQELIGLVAAYSDVPIIVGGGTKSIIDAHAGLAAGASAIAVGSLFSFYGKHRAVLINYCIDETNENSLLY